MKKVSTKIAIDTLGCKVNQYDSALLKEYFRHENIECVSSDREADIYIVNSCTVTAKADQEARHLLRRFRRKNPNAILVITGCYAQTGFKELSHLDGIHYIVGNTLKTSLIDILKKASYAHPKKPEIHVENGFTTERLLSEIPIHVDIKKTRVFLKIQDGCDDFCTFCVIPYARGKSRSLPPDTVIRQIQILVQEGVKEVVLAGVSLGSYGIPTRGIDLSSSHSAGGNASKINLALLVKRIEEETNLLRLRISSLEPEDVDDELIGILKESKIFCPHFHLPLQSADDKILKLMRRNYTVTDYDALIAKITKSFKDVFIGTDIICGFPGETDESFQKTFEFLRSLYWGKLHVFPYSPRRGTAAAKFQNQLPREEILRRGGLLRDLSHQRYQHFLGDHIGKKMLGLVEKGEGEKKGFYKAISRNYLSLYFKPERHEFWHNEEVSFIPFAHDEESLFVKPLH